MKGIIRFITLISFLVSLSISAQPAASSPAGQGGMPGDPPQGNEIFGTCTPQYTLACGGVDNWSTASAGATDVIDSYSCSSWNESGPEYTYAFSTPEPALVSVELRNLSVDLDIYAISGDGGTCNSENCITYGDNSLSFNAEADQPYNLVVDGYNGAVGSYTIAVTCETLAVIPPNNLTTTTINRTQIQLNWEDPNSHEDGYSIERSLDGITNWSIIGSVGTNVTTYTDNGLTCHTPYYYRVKAYNAYDISSPSNISGAWTQTCPTGICTPHYNLTCGSYITGDTTYSDSTDEIDHYPCSPWDESGPEYTVRFTPGIYGTATVTLSELTTDLDLFVIGDNLGNCSSGNCITYGDLSANFAIRPGQQYYLVVDGYSGAAGHYVLTIACTEYDHPGYLPVIVK